MSARDRHRPWFRDREADRCPIEQRAPVVLPQLYGPSVRPYMRILCEIRREVVRRLDDDGLEAAIAAAREP